MVGYEFIKGLASELKWGVKDLIVENEQHDPFFAGVPGQKAMGEWFAQVWEDLGRSDSVHLRGLHYRLVSQEDPKTHTGRAYENTKDCWGYLKNASKYARWLGLVPLDALPDRRNPDPHIFMRKYVPVDEYGQEIDSEPRWRPESIDWSMPDVGFYAGDTEWELPKFTIQGYEYHDILQPYHIEVWIEKSTMNDVLIPVCERHAVNFVTGLGNMSIPSVKDLLERIAELDKPTRIFYVSDFDPGGEGMPVSVARQIEYLLLNPELWREEEAKFDIKLDPIVLTKAQVKHYKLPRIPIKDTDARKKRFEDHHGEGAVELDALEALHPGVLARIVEKHIVEFRDMNLKDKIWEAKSHLQDKLDQEWSEKIWPFREKLEELKEKVEEITDSYKGRLDVVNEQLEQELEPYKDQLETLSQRGARMVRVV